MLEKNTILCTKTLFYVKRLKYLQLNVLESKGEYFLMYKTDFKQSYQQFYSFFFLK